MAKEGPKINVGIVDLNKKWQITSLLSLLLEWKVIFTTSACAQGTPRYVACLLTVNFPEGWCITCTHNHWCNKSTVEDYIS